MSDTSDSGATSSSGGEIKTGRQADNANAGFKEMPPNQPAERERKELTAREAGAELANRRTADNWPPKNSADADPVFYSGKDGKRAPENEAIDLRRAQDDLIAWRKAQEGNAEIDAMMEFDAAATKLRRDEGIEPEADQAQPQEPNQPQLDNEPSIPGLDPRVEAALKLPQLRQHLEAESAKVAQAESEYAAATKASHNAGLATFAVSFPEFQNHTAEQIIAKMRQMEHTNPQRYAHALNSLNKMAATERALIQNEQRMQHAQRQQFEHHARTEDAKFDRMVAHQTPAQKAAVGKEMVEYARELGISQGQLVHALSTNPVLRTAAFQKVISDAVEARLARKAVANYRNKAAPVPHVNKPGQAGAVVSRGQADLAALNKAFAGAKTQNDSLRAAAALLAAKRRGGR